MYEAPQARAADPDLANVEQFYQQLLLLDVVADVEPVLATALELLVSLSRSRLAYVELESDEPVATIGRGYANGSSLDVIRSQISYGIVRRVLTEGHTIETSSAFRDERFLELASVRQHEIEAVLCAPLGTRIPIGVLYLQGPCVFSADDRTRAEAFARRLARIAPRIKHRRRETRCSLAEQILDLQDCRVREAMERHDGNIAQVARELCVGRGFVYRVLRRIRYLGSVSG